MPPYYFTPQVRPLRLASMICRFQRNPVSQKNSADAYIQMSVLLHASTTSEQCPLLMSRLLHFSPLRLASSTCSEELAMKILHN